MNKRVIKLFFIQAFLPEKHLTGFHLFYCCAALFEENTVTTVGTPDVDVDLNFLLTPCALVCTYHTRSLIILLFARESGLSRAGQSSWPESAAGMPHRQTCTRICGIPRCRYPSAGRTACHTSGSGGGPLKLLQYQLLSFVQIFRTGSQNVRHYLLLFLLLYESSLPLCVPTDLSSFICPRN